MVHGEEHSKRIGGRPDRAVFTRFACVWVIGALGLTAFSQQPTANFDETKVPAYRLPDPLLTERGERVTTSKQWLDQRRPELIRLFEENVYGHAPDGGDPIFTVVSEEKNALNGSAIRRQVKVQFSGACPVSMTVLLYAPARVRAHATGGRQSLRPGTRVPVFVGLNFSGNQTVNADAGILSTNSWLPAKGTSRGADAASWPIEKIVGRGYALATVYDGDIAPDHVNNEAEGVFSCFTKPGEQRKSNDWATVAAWAWGLSRIVDYLETDPLIDKNRMIAIGHSRLGKAALWAGAQDTRFAAVISNESGEGGAALARRKFGERTKDLNERFPYWYCANYRRYNDREEDLPIDSHELLALIAPRPLYVASAIEDRWSDPKGEFLGALGADPVYRLFGVGLGATEMPDVEKPVLTRIAYHIRNGRHGITDYDWTQYLNWADAQLEKNQLGLPVR